MVKSTPQDKAWRKDCLYIVFLSLLVHTCVSSSSFFFFFVKDIKGNDQTDDKVNNRRQVSYYTSIWQYRKLLYYYYKADSDWYKMCVACVICVVCAKGTTETIRISCIWWRNPCYKSSYCSFYLINHFSSCTEYYTHCCCSCCQCYHC